VLFKKALGTVIMLAKFEKANGQFEAKQEAERDTLISFSILIYQFTISGQLKLVDPLLLLLPVPQ
jgi:hypothetical protein